MMLTFISQNFTDVLFMARKLDHLDFIKIFTCNFIMKLSK